MLIEFLTSFPVQVVVGVAAASTTMMNPSMSMTMANGAPPGKVLSLLEPCFHLISSSSPSMKIQIMGGKITENQWFQSPHGRSICFVLFLFIFNFSIKNCISLFLTIFEYLVLQIRYQ
jgi:hypothetical protein